MPADWDDLDCDDRVKCFLKSEGVTPDKAQELMELLATSEKKLQLEEGLESWLSGQRVSSAALQTLVDEVGLHSWADLDDLTEDVLASAPTLKPLQRGAVKRALIAYKDVCARVVLPALRQFPGLAGDVGIAHVVRAGTEVVEATAGRFYILVLEAPPSVRLLKSRRLQVYDVEQEIRSGRANGYVFFEHDKSDDGSTRDRYDQALGLKQWARENVPLKKGFRISQSFPVRSTIEWRDEKDGSKETEVTEMEPVTAVLWHP